MALDLIVPPPVEPVTLAEAKAYLRIGDDRSDTAVMAAILAARRCAEAFLGRSLIHQTWRWRFDHWPMRQIPWWEDAGPDITMARQAAPLLVPRPPLAKLMAIRTYAADDTPTTVHPDIYEVDTSDIVGRILLREDEEWPLPGRSLAGIEIEYVAGYGAVAAAVPQTIRAGILVELARRYAYRGDMGDGNTSRLALSLWQSARAVGI